jgi:hypothetical protein
MASTVFTGWRTVTPGACLACGFDDDWTCDGRGNVLCECQACTDCGVADAYGMHEPGCAGLVQERLDNGN